MKSNVNFKILLLLGTFLILSIVWNPVLAQIPPKTGISININTPFDTASVPSGDLTIYGTSSDDDTKNCQVYADWNDLKPMQSVTPNGPKGNTDYSKWSYTYTGRYHNIVEGSNELTSKITCLDQGQNPSSKFYSINVTGTKGGSEITKNSVQQSSEDTNTNTNNEATNVLPVKNTKNSSTDSSIQQSTEDTNTNNEATNTLPVKNTKSTGTYKILPLYSESSEKVANPASSENADKKEVTSTDTSKSQDSSNPAKIDNTDTKTLSSEQPQQSEVTSTDTSKSQDSSNPAKIDNTDTKTLSSEQPQQTEETITHDTNKPKITDSTGEQSSTDTNNYFTFEPDPQGDEKITVNDKNPDSDSSFPNHYDDGNSVFGLKTKSLGEVTKNQLDNKIQKLEEKASDHMHLFGSIG
ncbi:MAG: hypothetical protein E6L04_07990 [Thaumarchaeota archaeon]|nr:MAG: hypothetical protein E6L04_07990 [Nitrososphaerota archaeon]